MSGSRREAASRAPFEVWPVEAAPAALAGLVPAGFRAHWILVSRDGASVRDREQLLEMLQARELRQARARGKNLFFLRLT